MKPALPLIAFFLFVFCPGPDAAAAAETREEPTRLLQKAKALFEGAKDIAFDFEVEAVSDLTGDTEKYRGSLLLQGKNRFDLKLPRNRYVSDGATFWEYSAPNRQVLVKNPSPGEASPPGDILFRFLDAAPLSAEPARIKGKSLTRLRLDPKPALKQLDSLTAYLNPKDGTPFRIETLDAQGNRTRYTLLRVQRNQGVSPDRFVFKAPKGTETVDMR